MANRGVIAGRVLVGGSPAHALVGLKDIRQGGHRRGGASLTYYAYDTRSTNVPSVYTDKDGWFKIFIHWEPVDVGHFMDGTFQVKVLPTQYDRLYERATGQCLVTTDLGKLIANMLTTKLGISRAMAKWLSHVKWPSAASSMTTASNLGPEVQMLVGAVEVNF